MSKRAPTDFPFGFLTDDEGASLKVEGADFDPAKAMLYLKLNRSGVIRFRPQLSFRASRRKGL